MRKYTYIVIDDEQIYREQVIELVDEFNQAEQKHFTETHDTKIFLQLLRTHDGLNNSTLQDMENADIVFLDLRFGETEMGINLLNMVKNVNRKNIIVLTAYKAEYEQKANDYPQVLSWLHKPLNMKNLEVSIDKFFIKNEAILATFRATQVDIAARNTPPILYEDIICIKSGGQEVTLYLKNGEEKPFSANVLSVTRFEGRGNFKRISSKCAINIAFDWKTKAIENRLSVQLHGFHNLPPEELRIGNNFMSIVPVLSLSIAERIV